MPAVFNTIHPKLPSIPKVRGYILNAQRETADDIRRDMEQTVKTWHHGVVFLVIRGYRGGGTFVHVYTDDPAWNYLDQGTTERWAIMSNPFEAKTKTGWIGSGAGVGGPVVKGKQHMKRAMDGIEARMWSAVIRTKNQPKYEKRLYDAIVKGLVP